MISALWLIPLFAVANRFSGGGLGWRVLARDHGGPVPGRPITYAALLLALLLGVACGWVGFLAALSFYAWRLPGWYGGLDMGLVHHTIARDAAVMGARALLGFPLFAYVAVVQNAPVAILWLGFLALAVPAAYLAALRTPLQRLKPRDPGALSEWLAGAAWGLAVSATLAIGA